MYKVYLLTFPNGKQYCGQTSYSLEQRAGKDGQGYKGSHKVYNAIQKYGWDNVKKEILADYNTRTEANQKEEEVISQLQLQDDNFGYNISPGGDKVIDKKYAHEVLKERWADESYQEKMHTVRVNLWKQPEYREHQMEAKRKIGYNRGNPVVKCDKITGEAIKGYASARDAARDTAATTIETGRKNISMAANGSVPSAYGFKWRRPTQEDIEKLGLNPDGKPPFEE